MRYLAIPLAITIAFASCGVAPTESVSESEAEAAAAEALPDLRAGSTRQEQFQREWAAIRSHSNIAVPQYRAVRDSAVFSQFWHRATTGFEPRPAIPTVDFASEMVLVAAYGTGGGGDRIAIRRVVRGEDGLVAVVVRTHPGPNCLVAAVLTTPSAGVVLPRHSLNVRFVVIDRVIDCS